jgi:hypothetical protein
MKWKYFFPAYCFFSFLSVTAFSQNEWVLKMDKEGIKVYTKELDNSPFKAIKTVCIIDASLTRLTAVLLDIDNSADWVYSTKKCTLLKRLSAAELIYYSEIAVPWPVSNRDFIVRLKVVQDEKTRVVTIGGENKPAYLPENKNIVRIQQSISKWLIVPLPNGQVKIEYTLQVDPGGTVPAWLINLFATRGPFESFKNLRNQVKKAAYNQVRLPFIKD